MTEAESSSHDLHRLTALTWDASIPIKWDVGFPGGQSVEGHFLVPKMIPVHLCTKPMFDAIVTDESGNGVGFGTGKFKSWFEYSSRFNKHSFVAVIPWSVPIGVVVDWLIALEFPYEEARSSSSKDTLIEKLFNKDNALPFTLKFIDADSKILDDTPNEAIRQADFLHVDKQFAHKLWVSALLGSASEAVKLAPQIERSLRSWDPHTFFRGRRDMVKRAGEKASTALVAFHIVQPVLERRKEPFIFLTALRLVEVGTERMSTFGHLLKEHIFKAYSQFSVDHCLSTEPLAPELGLVRVLGMNPPLYTPLQFLRDNLCCRDFVLHVVVRPLANKCVATVPPPPTPTNPLNSGANAGGGGELGGTGIQGSSSMTMGNFESSASLAVSSPLSNNNNNVKQNSTDLASPGGTSPSPIVTTTTTNNGTAPKVGRIQLDDSPAREQEAQNNNNNAKKPSADADI